MLYTENKDSRNRLLIKEWIKRFDCVELTAPRSRRIWHLLKQSWLFENLSSILFASWICWGELEPYSCSHSFSSSNISDDIFTLQFYTYTYSIMTCQSVRIHRVCEDRELSVCFLKTLLLCLVTGAYIMDYASRSLYFLDNSNKIW